MLQSHKNKKPSSITLNVSIQALHFNTKIHLFSSTQCTSKYLSLDISLSSYLSTFYMFATLLTALVILTITRRSGGVLQQIELHVGKNRTRRSGRKSFFLRDEKAFEKLFFPLVKIFSQMFKQINELRFFGF